MEELDEKQCIESEEEYREQLRQEEGDRKKEYEKNRTQVSPARRRMILMEGINRKSCTEGEEWEYEKLVEEEIHEDKEYARAYERASPATREAMEELSKLEEDE